MTARTLTILVLAILYAPPGYHLYAKDNLVQPATLKPSELQLPQQLSEPRRNLIELGLQTATKYGWLKYVFGSADPTKGGFDCSGATYYLLRKSGMKPPRTSSGQYLWVKDASNLVAVNKDTTSLDDPVFARLIPGDLLFWAGTYQPTDGRTTKVTHVAIYAGKDPDGRPVMLNASSGRTFRGASQHGYGIFDFRLPRPGSRSKFLGYGSPPGLDELQ